MLEARFEPTIPALELFETMCSLDSSATGAGGILRKTKYLKVVTVPRFELRTPPSDDVQ
jgi:hypothetical protein